MSIIKSSVHLLLYKVSCIVVLKTVYVHDLKESPRSLCTVYLGLLKNEERRDVILLGGRVHVVFLCT